MDDFERAVEDGLALSKRLYIGRNDQPVTMNVESDPVGRRHFPTAPTVYAVITDPSIVDDPDLPSYQPQVYGRLDPPALIPVQMNGAELDVNCIVASAIVEFRGSFRVHCVATNRKCDCRVVVPTREKSSFLGAEVDVSGKSYCTELALVEDAKSYMERIRKDEDVMFLRNQIFSLTIPQVEGGSVLSIKIRWFQPVSYFEGWFSVSIPFTFKDSIPFGKLLKREKIHFTVESGSGKELTYKALSHPLKETTRYVGKLYLSYEAEVDRWSSSDFFLSYAASSADIFGGLLVQSAAADDFDKRDIFSLFIFPGSNPHKLVFSKEIIFLIDTSESMNGVPLEESKCALSEALLKLRSTDSFSIISFNHDICLFSSSLEPATEKNVEAANQWLNEKCQPTGGTNMLLPLSEALKMFSKNSYCIPHILLITDGSINDENKVLNLLKSDLCGTGPNSPRISTFGIGLYCNHYFLRMLALIGRGHYDSTYRTDAIFLHMERFFAAALNPLLTNISISNVKHLDGMEEHTIPFPELSLGCPLIISGRCSDNFSNTQNVTGSLADGREFTVHLNAQQTKGLLDQVVAKQQLDILTAQAWASGSNGLIEQITRISAQHNIPCEFTQMVVLPTSEKKTAPGLRKFKDGKRSLVVHGLHLGFGNRVATENNTRIVSAEANGGGGKDSDKDGGGLYCCNLSVLGDCHCCSCCGPDVGSTYRRVTDDLVIALTQCCAAVACFGCLECCSELCCK